MAAIVRLLVGLALLPACWGVARAFADSLYVAAEHTGFSAEVVSLVGGIAAFALVWATVPHPVKAYVLGHELTHALWGLFFGARPSDFHVGSGGGSVRLTKTNVFITLAPYFFPFYTFVVIVVALVTYAFMRPLPCLPLWMFLIGFTWAFHILFTIETLAERQPDVKLYGRIFSWVFIFLFNLLIVLVWLAAMTPLSFAELGGFLAHRTVAAYTGAFAAAVAAWKWISTKIGELK